MHPPKDTEVDQMNQKNPVIAPLRRLDRQMKRLGATAVRLLALGLFAAMVCSCRAMDIFG